MNWKIYITDPKAEICNGYLKSGYGEGSGYGRKNGRGDGGGDIGIKGAIGQYSVGDGYGSGYGNYGYGDGWGGGDTTGKGDGKSSTSWRNY